MSELSVRAEQAPPADRVSATPLPNVVARRRRRQLQVQVLRVALAVVLVGAWELGTRVKVIDPFFWGKPTGIANQIWIWVTEGTSQGPLWEQIAATMEETVLGFFFGVILGVTFGILLGSNRFLADIASPYIKAANAIPRVVLGSIFVLAFALGMQSKVELAGVLVIFVVFFTAFQGFRDVAKNLFAHAPLLGPHGRRITTEASLTSPPPVNPEPWKKRESPMPRLAPPRSAALRFSRALSRRLRRKSVRRTASRRTFLALASDPST